MAPHSGGSSRIIVKNLPRHATTQRLREHFGKQGELTDVRLQTTRDGRSRQFAFIGYRSEDDAARATKYYNRTFFDTTRISVELARKIGDDTLPRPWSRHSEGSSAFQRRVEREAFEGEKQRLAEATHAAQSEGPGQDQKLKEFLEVMQPRHKARLWSNDDVLTKGEANVGKHRVNRAKGSKKTERLVKSKKRGGDGVLLKQSHVKFDDVDGEEGNASGDDEYQEFPTAVTPWNDDPVEPSDDGVAVDNALSDMDYFKSRIRAIDDDSEGEAAEGGHGSSENGDDAEDAAEFNSDDCGKESQERTDVDASKDTIPEPTVGASVEGPEEGSQEDRARATARLLVQNIPYGATEEELAGFLEQHCQASDHETDNGEEKGALVHVHIVREKKTRVSKGYAFASFSTGEAASRTLRSAGCDIFQGRVLRILAARAQNNNGDIARGSAGEQQSGDRIVSFKQQREEKKRAGAGEGDDAFASAKGGSIFLRQDAVADGVAERLGVTKSELLDVSASDLAVRLALGETHAIAKITESLEAAGVDIYALKAQGMERSAVSSSILVKNLPHRADEDELRAMFEKYGLLSRWVFVPSGTLALLQFSEPSDAQKAFKGLAYRRYRNAPLYLQWVGKDVWRSAAPPEKDLKPAKKKPLVASSQMDDMDEGGSCLFVKNISFRTTDQRLRSHFEKAQCGDLRSVKIVRWKAAECKSDPKKEGLSKGFGFVEFDSEGAARETMAQMQGSSLDGHSLVLSVSNRLGASNSEAKGAKVRSGSTKLVVRNIPFEASKKDLQQLFRPLGQVKVLRLPRKFDGGHRGFAFVEFVSKQEARNAREALQSTHLYGRHLVIEDAQDETTNLSDLRAMTKSKFRNDEGLQTSGVAKRLRR